MNNKIIIDNEEFEIIVNRKRIKNLYLRVKEENKIEVSANFYTTNKEILKIINDNKAFIIKTNSKIKSNKLKPNKIMYLGDELSLIESDKTFIDNNYIYAKSEEDAINYIYSLCYDVFKVRLERIMNMFDNLPKFTLKVRKMKTRWGVCNKSSMTVTLNTELITKDVNLIDYVIVHELCHFKHMDHSSAFWNEVAKYYPYYKQARKELNDK